METFFRKHTEGFLVACTLILIGVMAWCFVWGITYISQNFDDVFESVPATAQTINFNLSGAQKLNLRGLAPHQ